MTQPNSRKALKITFISNNLETYGGLEKWHIFVANQLSQEYNVKVIGLPINKERRIARTELAKLLKFDYITMDTINSPIYSDVFYVSIGNKQVLDNIFTYCHGKKIFGAHHAEYIYYTKNGKINWLKDIISISGWRYKLWIRRLFSYLSKFDCIHTVNDSINSWEKYTKVFSLPNVSPLPPPPTAEKYSSFTVLFYGRLEKVKGVKTLEYVIKHLNPKINLIIAGSGSYENRIAKLCNSKNHSGRPLHPNVHFTHFVSDSTLCEILSKSHLVLFPSYMEGASLVKMESLQYGVPIVYRKTSFNRDLNSNSFCKGAVTNKDFLTKINELYLSYALNPSNYFYVCKVLKESAPSMSEYIQKLSGLFVACSDLKSGVEEYEFNEVVT